MVQQVKKSFNLSKNILARFKEFFQCVCIMLSFDIDSNEYQKTLPYPHTYVDDVLNVTFAKDLQNEILSLSDNCWDRYENPFEQKYTLRDKYAFPPLLQTLFTYLESKECIDRLSSICGYSLYADTTRNFWGVHVYKPGDKLDIHVDAGIHPHMKKKKQLTLGIYLSSNWKEEYGCELEIWRGDSAVSQNPTLYEKITIIPPLFNRLILFTCNDYSWHGNPEPAVCPEKSRRIFITISYMSDNQSDTNKKVKALFIARPNDTDDPKKEELRQLRADPQRYKDIYRLN